MKKQIIMKKNKILQTLKRSFGIPKLLKLFSYRFGCCEKCGLPWNHCKSKTVWYEYSNKYSERSGTFATCDFCWNNSTLNELQCHYAAVYTRQKCSLYGTEYKMDHTCEHLLNCVEIEYNKTHKI
jgi:hypothetical protein